MRHYLKKQHECSYLLLFTFQSNNLFSSGEIFTAANVSLLCHVFVIHGGKIASLYWASNPPHEESYFEFCVFTPPSVGRCASVLSPKPCTRFTPSLFENLSSFPSLASYVPSSNPNPNSGHLVHSSIWRIREKLLTFNPASSTFLPPQ